MSRDTQERLCREHPVFERYFLRMLEGPAVATHRRMLMLLSATAEQRYDDFVSTYPAMARRLPQRQVASYLGITPEAPCGYLTERWHEPHPQQAQPARLTVPWLASARGAAAHASGSCEPGDRSAV